MSSLEFPPGWTCEVTIVRLESYVRRTLPRHDALAVAEHLEACWECAHFLAFRWERLASHG